MASPSDREVFGWGTWREDRRYPAKDSKHMIIVWKRIENYGEPKIRWKNTRIKLTRDELDRNEAA